MVHPKKISVAYHRGLQAGRSSFFRLASSNSTNDKNTVLATVSRDGLALEFAPNELKDDKDVVLAAVSQNGLALNGPRKNE